MPTPILTFIAVLGPILLIVGQIISLIASFNNVIGVFGKATGAAGTATSAFGGKLLMIIGIVIAVAAAITILVLAINALTGKSGAFVSQVNSLSNVKIPTPEIPQVSMPGYSYASGIDYVPSDRVALIHQGERIQRADENPYNPAATRASGGDTIILNVNMSEVDEVYKLVNVVKQAKQTRRAGYAGV